MPLNAEPLRLPCGQCIGCRLDRSQHWATRLMHESRSHETNSFITLTYEDEYLPPDGSLYKSHFQKFMKRLRKQSDAKLKFFHCGEYGASDKTLRPHYHAILFGMDFPDKQLFTVRNEIPVYTSDRLTDIWGMGFTTCGDVTYESCAYVARYTLKKINGHQADIPDPETGLRPYDRVHAYTGEIIEVLPEYATQSNGLGKDFIKKYTRDVYDNDMVVINGKKTRPPRYYDNYYESIEPEDMEAIRADRINRFQAFASDNTRHRLRQRKTVKEAQTKTLQRHI